MGWFNQFRKGVKAAKMAMKDKESYEEHLRVIYEDFINSEQRKNMFIGDRYYRVKNDILKRKMKRKIEGKEIEETYKANNKLAHANYKIMVDEKVEYVFGREYTLTCKDKEYLRSVQKTLGTRFKHLLMKTGYEASNKAIAWLHPYINELGEFKILLAPAERCAPEWKDNNHDELVAMHYISDVPYFEKGERKYRTHIETWTADGVTCRIKDGINYVLNREQNIDESGNPISHYQQSGEWTSWGKVPWIPLKNNDVEMADIAFVKSLIDNYDKSRSEAANYVEETKNLIFILKGYRGNSMEQFLTDINEKRAIILDSDDDDESTGVNTLTPTMDITALREHYEQLKRDITESGQGVMKDLDKFGQAPSGVALSFLYSGLDMKADALITHATFAFEEVLYFVNAFLDIKNPPEISITFNRDRKIDETDKINNLNSSSQRISQDTYLANHPYVKNVEEEKEKLKAEREENSPFVDKVGVS